MRLLTMGSVIIVLMASLLVAGCNDDGGDDNAFGQGFRSGLGLVESEGACIDRVRDFVLDAIHSGNFWSLALGFIEATGCAKHLIEQAVEQIAPGLLSSRDDG